MNSAVYTTTNWKDYPNTTTPITAAQLNRIESHTIRIPKETATFLLDSIFGGLKEEKYFAFINSSTGVTISANDYKPSNGDKLAVFKDYAVPCIENTDYTLTETANGYTLKAIDTIIQNVCVQIWNIPIGGNTPYYGISTAQTSGTDTAEYGVMTEVEQ